MRYQLIDKNDTQVQWNKMKVNCNWSKKDAYILGKEDPYELS